MLIVSRTRGSAVTSNAEEHTRALALYGSLALLVVLLA